MTSFSGGHMSAMSRLALATTGAAALVMTASAPASASVQTAEGSFTIQFPQGHPASNAPCPSDAFCGVGSLSGYGPATITIVDETFDPIDDSDCFAVTRVEEVDLLRATGSLVLESTGTFCRPGGSGGSNASDRSYGSPGSWSFTTTVDSAAGTGVFAGVAGSGVESMVTAGGVGTWHLSLQLRS